MIPKSEETKEIRSDESSEEHFSQKKIIAKLKSPEKGMNKSQLVTKSLIGEELHKYKQITRSFRSSAFNSDLEEDLIFSKYTIFWNYKKENIKFDTIIELPHTSTVETAIKVVIPIFNSIFVNQKCNILLADDPNQFQLFLAKKNGQPNPDFPPLDKKQFLNQVGAQRFTLVEKNSSLAIINGKNLFSLKFLKSNETKSRIEPQQDSLAFGENTGGFITGKSSFAEVPIMVDPDMPAYNQKENAKENVSNNDQLIQKIETTEEITYCCCCKIKNKRSEISKYNTSMQPQNHDHTTNNNNTLSEKLISN